VRIVAKLPQKSWRIGPFVAAVLGWGKFMEVQWHSSVLGKHMETHVSSCSGWWFVNPSEKYESVGMILPNISNIWKVIKFHGSKPPTGVSMFFFRSRAS
jgi:hypothetical protein